MKKGVVLIIVFGVLIVISLLAITAINLMRQQSKITEHKISRRRKLLAAQAGMVHAYEGLRRGIAPYDNPPPINDSINVGSAPHALTVQIRVLAPGGSAVIGGNTINCPATAPSDSCIHAYVPD
ncbi:MAG: hypothetical protein K9L80_01205 [Candidatus Omnitrophica bacterium]|nr:hypothetical protein [Candidatus Omnitrophota bacterium]MCF7887711.1 hypothetical protein [Candidatus Omnitrophota bacterium]